MKTGTTWKRDTIIEDADGYAWLFQALNDTEARQRICSEATDAIRLIADVISVSMDRA